jgi:hypothetical protein
MRFHPGDYNPIEKFDGEGYAKLMSHLLAGTAAAGYDVVRNGSGGKDQTKRMWICPSYVVYKASESNLKEDNPRAYSLVNDKANARPDGKKMKRQSSTNRAATPQDKCRFRFTIQHDETSFYLQLSTRPTHWHCNHNRKDPEHLRPQISRIPAGPRRAAHNNILSGAADGMVQNNLYLQTGMVYGYASIARMRETIMSNLGEDITHCTVPVANDSKHNSLDKLVIFLLAKQNKVLILSDDSCDSPPLSTLPRPNSMVHSSFSHGIAPVHGPSGLTGESAQNAVTFAADARVTGNVQPSQKMFCGMAFGHVNEIRRGRLFPDVLFIDATEKTNKEDRPLLCIAMKDSSGKVFISIMVFMPCLTRWAYRWVFRRVLVEFLGETITERVHVIITDGDAQQNGELDAAVQQLFPQVKRLRCGWHIIDRTWHRLGPRCQHSNLTPRRFGQVKDFIMTWMYSWMRTGHTEDDAEYRISKSLLLDYVVSIKDHFGKGGVDVLLAMFHGNIEVYEDHYRFDLRKKLRHFDQCMNTPLEGCNKGMKYCSAPVKPGFTVPHATHNLAVQTSKRAEVAEASAARVLDSHQLFAKLPVSQEITVPGAKLLEAEWRASDLYMLERQSMYEFHVCRKDGRGDKADWDQIEDTGAVEAEEEEQDQAGGAWLDLAPTSRDAGEPNAVTDFDMIPPPYVDPVAPAPATKKKRWPPPCRASPLAPVDGKQTKQKKWKSKRRRTKEEGKFAARVIPSFVRPRLVVATETAEGIFLTCSCCLQERCGYPCRHVCCVLRGLRPDTDGPRCTDIDLYWRREYSHYGLNPKYPEFAAVMAALVKLPCPGVEITAAEIALTVGHEEFPCSPSACFVVYPAMYSCSNYSATQIQASLLRNGLDKGVAGIPLQMSQTTYGDDEASSGSSDVGQEVGHVDPPIFGIPDPEDAPPAAGSWTFYGAIRDWSATAQSLYENLGRDHPETKRVLTSLRDCKLSAQLAVQTKLENSGVAHRAPEVGGVYYSACPPTSTDRTTHGCEGRGRRRGKRKTGN